MQWGKTQNVQPIIIAVSSEPHLYLKMYAHVYIFYYTEIFIIENLGNYYFCTVEYCMQVALTLLLYSECQKHHDSVLNCACVCTQYVNTNVHIQYIGIDWMIVQKVSSCFFLL